MKSLFGFFLMVFAIDPNLGVQMLFGASGIYLATPIRVFVFVVGAVIFAEGSSPRSWWRRWMWRWFR